MDLPEHAEKVSSKADKTKKAPGQYDAVKWGPWRGIMIVAVSFIGAQAVTILLFSILRSILSEGTFNIFFTESMGQFITVLVSYGLAVYFLWLFLRQRKATNLAAVGLGRQWVGKDMLLAVAGFVVYFGLFLLITSAVSSTFHLNTDNQQQDVGFQLVTGRVDLVLAFVSLVLIPPIVEETLFRGVLFGGLRKKLPFIWATLITSVLFAIPHTLEAKDGGVLWTAGIDTLVLSFVLCYLREKTGSIWASIFLHGLKNCIAFLFLFVFHQ